MSWSFALARRVSETSSAERARLIVPVTLVLVAALMSACQPSGTNQQSTRPVHCTVIVDGPKRYDNGNSITGRARYRCGSPGAEKLTLKIRLEKQHGSSWSTVASQSFTITGKATIAPELKYQEKTVSVPCQTGIFRTIVDWSRTSRGTTEGDNLVSGDVRDPCVNIFGNS